jgi:oligoendopeptidase F
LNLVTELSPRWDLSDLYAGLDDPRIALDLERLGGEATRFRETCRGKTPGATPETLVTWIRAHESLVQDLFELSGYAALVFSTDSISEPTKVFYERIQSTCSQILNDLQFFEVELKELDQPRFDTLLAAQAIAPYRHHLQRLRQAAPHTLSDAEERLANLKNLTGTRAWQQLYSETTAGMRFPVDRGEGETALNLSEVRALRAHPDRNLRARSVQALLQGFSDRGSLFGFITNTLYQDHTLDLKLRQYPRVYSSTLLEDDVDEQVFHALIETIESGYDLVHTYYGLKATALGLSDFAGHDLLAPYGSSPRRIAYPEACQIVTSTFDAFTPAFGDIAREFIHRGWIDVPSATGKQGGAFCAGVSPRLHPWILLNYTERLEDIATLAHELGHGIHFMLSRQQSFFQYQAVTPMAEMASTFGELLVLERLLATETDPEVQLQLRAKRFEDAIVTVFRQTMYTRWEWRVRELALEGPLGADTLCQIWNEETARLYGNGVAFSPLERWGWATIPHLAHHRFYCYSYAFGQLLVYALFQKFRDEGSSFVPGFLEALSSGSSASPGQILAAIGQDIRDPHFWRRGLTYLQTTLSDFAATL